MAEPSKEGWVWYGYAGHLIVASKCAYHLCTRVGPYLVSTVGHYLHNDKMETIGGAEDSFFETYVFNCDGETESGDPNITEWSEIDGERYATSNAAEDGHYRHCNKYHNIWKQEHA